MGIGMVLSNVAVILSLLWGVGGNKTNPTTPAPIEKEFFNDSNMIQVWEYRWNGLKVFFDIPDGCDQYIMVYSLNCEPICAPSGGISGNGKGKCPDFYTDAEVVEQVFPL